MPRSLFCGACFSYIIPPPVTVCQVVFGIFFRRMQKNRSDQEKIVSSVKPGKKGRCTASRTAALFVLRYFHSFSTCLVFIFCLLMFPSCRPHQPGKQKTQIDPQNKTHDACRQYHCAASFLLPYFTIYHLSDAIAACRKRQDHCPTCKLFCAGALQDSAASAILLTTLI